MIKREIYSVRFNKVAIEKDMLSTIYYVGEKMFYSGRGWLTPLKIDYLNKIKKDRLIITFEGGTYHEIGITADTEIFWRDVKLIKEKK